MTDTFNNQVFTVEDQVRDNNYLVTRHAVSVAGKVARVATTEIKISIK